MLVCLREAIKFKNGKTWATNYLDKPHDKIIYFDKLFFFASPNVYLFKAVSVNFFVFESDNFRLPRLPQRNTKERR